MSMARSLGRILSTPYHYICLLFIFWFDFKCTSCFYDISYKVTAMMNSSRMDARVMRQVVIVSEISVLWSLEKNWFKRWETLWVCFLEPGKILKKFEVTNKIEDQEWPIQWHLGTCQRAFRVKTLAIFWKPILDWKKSRFKPHNFLDTPLALAQLLT